MPNDYKYKLRDLAGAKNLSIDWDDQNKTVSIGGQRFDTTGWQNINGRFMGTEQMARDFLTGYQVPSSNMPSGNIAGVPPNKAQDPTPNIMQNPSMNLRDTTSPIYSNEINALTNQLGSAVQGFNKPYDLNSDPVYQQLRKYQESQMLQSAASRGMIYDDNTKARVEQSNMMLGQQFQQQDQLRQLQNIQNLQGQLNTLTGLEDRAMNREQNLYGMALTPQTREYMNALQNLTLEQRQEIQQYSDNYAAEINKLPEGDPKRRLLEAARFQKVISDPLEFRDYLINDYGLSPFQVDNIVIRKKLEEAQLNATNEKEAMELQRLMLQVEKAYLDNQKAGIDVERAGVDLQGAEISNQKSYYETLIAQIKASVLPEQLKADLNKTIADTKRTNTATQIDMKKLDELTVDSSEGVKDGFSSLVKHLSMGKDLLSWLDSTVIWDENEGREYKASQAYSPEELSGILKLANSSKLITDRSELDKMLEIIEKLSPESK